MGWYGGDGARLVDTVQPSAPLPQTQPDCPSDAATGLIDCGNWAVSAVVERPGGRDVRHLLREAGPRGRHAGSSHVFFIVRDDDGRSDLLFQTSDTTWQAYNRYGGNSLYAGSSGRSRLQGLLQPAVHDAGHVGRGLALQQRVPDGPLAGAQRLRRLLLHGRRQRPARRRDPRAQGVPVRRPRRVLVGRAARERRGGPRCRREPRLLQRQRGVLEDPLGERPPHAGLLQGDARQRQDRPEPRRGPGTWRDARSFNPRGRAGPRTRSPDHLHRQLRAPRSIQVPGRRGQAAALAEHDRGRPRARPDRDARPTDTLGYEWDEDLDNGARPAGLVRLSSTTAAGVQKLQDYGSHLRTGHRDAPPDAVSRHERRRPGRARLRRRAPCSGPGASTTSTTRRPCAGQPRRCSRPRPTCSPTWACSRRTLQPGLSGRSASTDTTPPTAAISAPVDGATVSRAEPVRITGTATDARRPRRRGRGLRRRRRDLAPGDRPGQLALLRGHRGAPERRRCCVRAADDSGNLGAATRRTVTVLPRSCPCSLFGNAEPAQPIRERRSVDRGRHALPGERSRDDHGPALLPRRRLDRDPGRQALQRGRGPARRGHVPGDERRRLAAGAALAAGHRDGGHDLCRRRTTRSAAITRSSRASSREPRGSAARGAGRRSGQRQRRLPLRRWVPGGHLPGEQLLGRRGLRAG